MSDKSSRKADLWQRKYYESLDELEQKEQQWQQLEALLRRLASRLTLLSDASNEQLEKKLDRLRSKLRYEDDAFRFQPLIEEVSAAIADADGGLPSRRQGANFEAATTLASLLDELNIPSSLQRQEKHVRKRLARARSARDIPELVKDTAELLMLAIESLIERKTAQEDAPADRREEEPADETEIQNEREAGEKTGFLKKLFARERTGSSVDELPRVEQEPSSALSSEDTDMDVGQDITPPTGQADVGDIGYAAGILIELLQKLELPHDLCTEAGLIRQRLQPCADTEALAAGLEATAELVAEAHGRILDEKKELEAFLKQLTERLREIDSDLQETVRLQQLSVDGSREINAAVEKEVRGIEASVEQARDLGALQTDIQSRVILIRDHMDKFLQTALQRDRQAGDVSAHLKQQLQQAEEEIEALRRQLEEEREQSLRDALTGLANRRAYDQAIADELARFQRYGSAFVLAVWDVDHFKSINDTYGHAAGDKVLKIIAGLIARNTRQTDMVARYGGEEFVVIMPETGIEAARVSLDKVRGLIEDCAFHFRGRRVVITASCGLTASRPEDTPESIFRRADSALYRAKENGRNRCEAAD